MGKYVIVTADATDPVYIKTEKREDSLGKVLAETFESCDLKNAIFYGESGEELDYTELLELAEKTEESVVFDDGDRVFISVDTSENLFGGSKTVTLNYYKEIIYIDQPVPAQVVWYETKGE